MFRRENLSYRVEVVNEYKPLLNLKQRLKSTIQSVGRAVKKRSKKLHKFVKRKEKFGKVSVMKKGVLNNAIVNPRSCKSDLKIS